MVKNISKRIEIIHNMFSGHSGVKKIHWKGLKSTGKGLKLKMKKRKKKTKHRRIFVKYVKVKPT